MSNGKRKPEIIAFAPVWTCADPVFELKKRALMHNDMRLVVTPLRYRVERYANRSHGWGGFGWLKIQTFPRTRNTYVEQEFDCAVSMFERRVRERDGVLSFRVWPSHDGRLTPLHKLTTGHLLNIFVKITRDHWRMSWLPYIAAELDRRPPEEVKHGKSTTRV